AVLEARKFLDEQGFVEVETPMLTKSTPEGARDYLVPSRVNPGKFYALPQSPQLFKQLLMISGLDRYFQIARCFRDEDLRAERQPEFTQIDLEMSYVQRDDVLEVVERLVQRIFESAGFTVELPMQRLTYEEAMERYGSDKPDLRYGCELQDVTSWAQSTDFRIFQQAENVKAIVAPGCGKYSRKEIDLLELKAKEFGAAGLIWLKKGSEGLQSSVLKAVGEPKLQGLWSSLAASDRDLTILVAGKRDLVNNSLGMLRTHLARKEQWFNSRQLSFVWVTDFPLFQFDEEEKRYVSVNHPFTAPLPEWIGKMEADPGNAKAQAYDIVCNGYEIGGGSIRIHDAAVQERAFRVLTLTREEAYEKFGFLLDALQYGAPPHGGIALGMDRIAMLLVGAESIREVIAFPKTSSAQCLMTNSPSPVSSKQLRDLHIRLEEDEPGK
ncbi:MAG TPA: aspartate--tRNA ligase, partial [Acidobacteriota bacterium]|nr:aspartate--tRNA ligase [Acidobacteriota bacterium]